MKWLIEVTVDDWNISIGGEDNLERTFVGRGDGFEGSSDARSRENRDVVDGYDKGANIFATNVPNPRGRGIRDDSRDISSLSNVALLDFETEVWMLARDRRGQLIKTFERIVGHFQVDGREIQTVMIDHAIICQIP